VALTTTVVKMLNKPPEVGALCQPECSKPCYSLIRLTQVMLISLRVRSYGKRIIHPAATLHILPQVPCDSLSERLLPQCLSTALAEHHMDLWLSTVYWLNYIKPSVTSKHFALKFQELLNGEKERKKRLLLPQQNNKHCCFSPSLLH